MVKHPFGAIVEYPETGSQTNESMAHISMLIWHTLCSSTLAIIYSILLATHNAATTMLHVIYFATPKLKGLPTAYKQRLLVCKFFK